MKRLAWARRRRVKGSLDSSAFAIIENTDSLERNKLFCVLSILDGWPSDDSALRWREKRKPMSLLHRKNLQCHDALGCLEFCVELLTTSVRLANWYRIPAQFCFFLLLSGCKLCPRLKDTAGASNDQKGITLGKSESSNSRTCWRWRTERSW